MSTVLRVDILKEVLYSLTEIFPCFFVQIADSDSRGQDGVIWVSCGLVCSRFRGKVVQLDGGDTFVDPLNHFTRDLDGVNVVLVETIAKFGDSRCDLVELDHFLATICFAQKESSVYSMSSAIETGRHTSFVNVDHRVNVGAVVSVLRDKKGGKEAQAVKEESREVCGGKGMREK